MVNVQETVFWAYILADKISFVFWLTLRVSKCGKVEIEKVKEFILSRSWFLLIYQCWLKISIEDCFGANIFCCTCAIELVVSAIDRVDVALLRSKNRHHLLYIRTNETLKWNENFVKFWIFSILKFREVYMRHWTEPIYPCRCYLRHCLLAAQKLHVDIYNSFLEGTSRKIFCMWYIFVDWDTFLWDRKTTIKTWLESNPTLLEEPAPAIVAERYNGWKIKFIILVLLIMINMKIKLHIKNIKIKIIKILKD